jgi:ABC-type polysaccharide/polyol phosphate export permease
MWQGDYKFVLHNLITKDFRIRYRNMSLGVFWSVLNPLVMMAVLTFVFTKIMVSPLPHFAVFLFCGLVPYNFFSIGWISGTTSLVDNASLIKRVPVPREVIPISAVLSNCAHLLIQMGLLIILVLISGISLNVHWVWIPLLLLLEIVFVCGLSLLFSGLNVYIRDMRYVVESAALVLWWLVPIIYDFSMIPAAFKDIYQYNPIAALVLAMRTVILDAQAPSHLLLYKLCGVSFITLALGWYMFTRLERRFYTYL